MRVICQIKLFQMGYIHYYGALFHLNVFDYSFYFTVFVHMASLRWSYTFLASHCSFIASSAVIWQRFTRHSFSIVTNASEFSDSTIFVVVRKNLIWYKRSLHFQEWNKMYGLYSQQKHTNYAVENSKYEAMNVDWVKESDTKLVNSAILLHFAFNMCNLRCDSHSVANPPIQYIHRT